MILNWLLKLALLGLIIGGNFWVWNMVYYSWYQYR